MKVIDGKNAVLGRLASYVAKESLKGEEIIILNCDEVLITGNKKSIEKELLESKSKIGTTQQGPKPSRTSEKIVKRVIRGMLPDHRVGRGKEALKRIKCFKGSPREFEDKKKIIAGKEKPGKISRIKEFIEKKMNDPALKGERSRVRTN